MDSISLALAKKYTNSKLDKVVNIDNEAVNGDFAQGLNVGWVPLSSITATVIRDVENKISSGSMHIIQDNKYASYYQDIVGTPGDKYYLSFWVYFVTEYPSDNHVWLSDIGNPNNHLTANRGAKVVKSTTGVWQRQSAVYTPGTAGATLHVGRIINQTAEWYVSGITVINLTEMFGAGSEPSVITFDETYMSQHNNYLLGTSGDFVVGDLFIRETALQDTIDGIMTNSGLQDVLNRTVIDQVCYQYTDTESYVDPSGISTAAQLYALYDALVTTYPDYITKTLIATEASVSALPVYRYDFSPPIPKLEGENDQGNVTTPNPKIFISTGIHNEVSAVFNALRFFTSLCNNWKTNELLSALRWNVHFVVVPLVNPWGFENSSRYNSNNVDLNRNFTLGWETGDYKGTAALSEVESQAIDDIATAEDFIFAIDSHNFATFEYGDKIMYMISHEVDNGRTDKFKRNLLKFGNLKLMRDFAFVSQGNKIYTDDVLIPVNDSVNGMLYAAFEPTSLIMEFAYAWGSGYTDENATAANLQKYAAEFLAVLFYQAYKEFS